MPFELFKNYNAVCKFVEYVESQFLVFRKFGSEIVSRCHKNFKAILFALKRFTVILFLLDGQLQILAA
jgi:hypothetical protein